MAAEQGAPVSIELELDPGSEKQVAPNAESNTKRSWIAQRPSCLQGNRRRA